MVCCMTMNVAFALNHVQSALPAQRALQLPAVLVNWQAQLSYINRFSCAYQRKGDRAGLTNMINAMNVRIDLFNSFPADSLDAHGRAVQQLAVTTFMQARDYTITVRDGLPERS